MYSTASGGVLGYTRFVYRGAHVGFETDSAGTIGMKYVWGLNIDDLIAFQDGSGNHYYVAKDKLGSIRNVATRSGTWVMRLSHLAYGGLIDSIGTGVMLRYRWTGREWDAELGWYFMRARYYDPVASRFTQEDPIGFAGGDNLYAYVGGSPLERRDPTGLKAGNVDTGFEGFCFSSGACVNWDGSVRASASGWTTGGGAGVSSSYLDQGRAGFELAYEASVGVRFEGTSEEVERMRNEWAHALRALREGARTEVRGADYVLRQIGSMTSGAEWTFRSGEVAGAIGQYNGKGSLSFTIDFPALAAALTNEEQVSLASVMTHEFGHAFYNERLAGSSYSRDVSDYYAGQFESAYRASVGWQQRPSSHGAYPRKSR